MNTLDDYYKALRRLVNNTPINVPKNTKINNDTVALEAGRKRGSIKKSREIFSDLISEIEKISQNDKNEDKELLNKLIKYKNKALEYKELYEESLNRELMLIERIKELEIKIENTNNVKNFISIR
jgi:hypothetical protein